MLTMNKEIKEKWIAALRSGEYEQGKGTLRTSDNKFCCLGVLEDIRLKEIGKDWNKELNGSFSIEGNSSYLTGECKIWADLRDSNPRPANDDFLGLANLNDEGKTFEEIADIIEKGF